MSVSGLVEIRVEDDAEVIRAVRVVSSALIVGFDSQHVDADGQLGGAIVSKIFDGAEDMAPVPSQTLVAWDLELGGVPGAATVESYAPLGLLDLPLDKAQLIARTHYVLSALWVRDAARSRGRGGTLSEGADGLVVRSGGRYLDGFVDDRNGSDGFYMRAGAAVGPHDVGLPARHPTYVVGDHPPGLHGRWFHIDCVEPARGTAIGDLPLAVRKAPAKTCQRERRSVPNPLAQGLQRSPSLPRRTHPRPSACLVVGRMSAMSWTIRVTYDAIHPPVGLDVRHVEVLEVLKPDGSVVDPDR